MLLHLIVVKDNLKGGVVLKNKKILAVSPLSFIFPICVCPSESFACTIQLFSKNIQMTK